MKPTKTLIYAAARDVAARNARKRGVLIMDDEANDAYHAEFDRLFTAIGGPEGWMELS